jgi:prevent-host-death family protein
MKDHISRSGRGKVTLKSVGVRELKTHAAHIVRQVRERRASYLVTHRGRPIGVILPVDGEGEIPHMAEAVDAPTAWNTFLRAGRQLERRFVRGTSAVRLLSDMRR